MSRTLLVLAMSTAACLAVASEQDKPAAPFSDDQLIQSATKAAPAKGRRGREDRRRGRQGRRMRTLREGSNGFTCMPDNPTTPGPDPMCMDAAAMDVGERMDVEEAAHRRQGRPDVHARRRHRCEQHRSVRDRARRRTTIGCETGPHVMIVGAAPEFYAMYPKNADPDTAVPYVMWSGTPYQHLMIPVR